MNCLFVLHARPRHCLSAYDNSNICDRYRDVNLFTCNMFVDVPAIVRRIRLHPPCGRRMRTACTLSPRCIAPPHVSIHRRPLPVLSMPKATRRPILRTCTPPRPPLPPAATAPPSPGTGCNACWQSSTSKAKRCVRRPTVLADDGGWNTARKKKTSYRRETGTPTNHNIGWSSARYLLDRPINEA